MAGDWVNWSQYSAAVTPEAQRLADEREQLRQQQKAQMDAALGGLREHQQENVRTGATTDVTQYKEYNDLLRQQQAAQAQWSNAQARGWEAMLMGPGGQQPQPSGWDNLTQRVSGLQEQGQKDIKVREQRAKQKADEERQAGLARIRQQQQKQQHDADVIRYKKYLADNYGGAVADEFDRLTQAEQDQQLQGFTSGTSYDEALRTHGHRPRWVGKRQV